MVEKRYEPVAIAEGLYKLGTDPFPAYLSLGDEGMIIEGGIGGTFNIIVEQIKELGIEPERIKYLSLTHTHPDHIGAVPPLKKLWPHLKVVAGQTAAELLKTEETINDFLVMDRILAEIMLKKGEIDELPPASDGYVFEVDTVVGEGDRIDLGAGVAWTVYDTPGHSPCHVSLYDEKDGVLMVGDASGFYVPEKDEFWPNYFHSLENYCDSIRKLAALPARLGALGHNHIVKDGLKDYFRRALEATEAYHLEMLRRVGGGEDSKTVARDKAKWVSTLTDSQPYEIMYSMSKVLIMRSQSVDGRQDLFIIP